MKWSREIYIGNSKNCLILPLTILLCFFTYLCPELVGSEFLTRGDFEAFMQKIENKEDEDALRIGSRIFSQLKEQYQSDVSFLAIEAKLQASEFLARRMISELKMATTKQINITSSDVFEPTQIKQSDNLLKITPALSFYETSVSIFSKPLWVDWLKKDEKLFLTKYYDLKLRQLTTSIAKAGQGLSIAEPSFQGTHDFVLVLPLLHCSETKPINISMIPLWMLEPKHAKKFADSSLLHFGFPFHAMTLAKEAAKLQKKVFNEVEFYRNAAKQCGTNHVNIAVECLERAVKLLNDTDIPKSIEIRFEIVQLLLNSSNYTLAAGQAGEIFKNYGSHPDAGKAIWLYYYALSRANNAEKILLDIDRHLQSKRCQQYQAKLLYIKWWALRRKRVDTAHIAVLEHELLQCYGDNPMVAPILLSQATDLLASQDYNKAYEILAQLNEKFPKTEAAAQAKRMMQKLKSVKNIMRDF